MASNGKLMQELRTLLRNTDYKVIKVRPNKEYNKSPQKRTTKEFNRLSKTRYSM